jgi:hypothetical protein
MQARSLGVAPASLSSAVPSVDSPLITSLTGSDGLTVQWHFNLAGLLGTPILRETQPRPTSDGSSVASRPDAAFSERASNRRSSSVSAANTVIVTPAAAETSSASSSSSFELRQQPPQPPLLVIAQEFFDALPIHRFQYGLLPVLSLHHRDDMILYLSP